MPELMCGRVPAPYAPMVIGLEDVPDPKGWSVPFPEQVVPRFKRIESPDAKVVALTALKLLNGLVWEPVPLPVAEQSM